MSALRSLLLATSALVLPVAVPAAAGAATMSVTATAEVVEGSATTVEVSGTFGGPAYVQLKARAGGGPCAATPEADGGTPLLDRSSTGSTFRDGATRVFDAAGTYVVCGWARDTTQAGGPIVAAAQGGFTVRVPKLSLGFTAPAGAAVDEEFTIVSTAGAEVARTAYAGLMPDGGKGCPATFAALQRTGGSLSLYEQAGWAISGTGLTRKDLTSLPRKGKYLLCGYVHRGPTDAAPQATAKAALTVGAPCVLPKLAGKTRAQAKKALVKAGCRLGITKKAKSASVKRGRVIRAGKKAGTELAPLTAVGIVVSTGPGKK